MTNEQLKKLIDDKVDSMVQAKLKIAVDDYFTTTIEPTPIVNETITHAAVEQTEQEKANAYIAEQIKLMQENK